MASGFLGKTGLKISPIGLGTVKLGRNTHVKYPQPFELPTQKEALDILENAMELGINFFDTAPAYGASERAMAPFVSKYRDRMILSSKCGEVFDGNNSTYDFSPESIRNSVESSLRTLKTDYLDVLLLHSNGKDVQILSETDALPTMIRLKEQGKTRSIGISLKTISGISRAAEVMDVIMAPMNSDDDSLGEELSNAHERGCGIIAIKGLRSGHLNGVSVEESVRFVLKNVFIDVLVVGTLNKDHLRQVVHAGKNVREFTLTGLNKDEE